MLNAELKRLSNGDKLYKIIIYENNKKIKTIKFGSRSHEQYPTHKNPERKRLYIMRHQNKEDWTKKGILTAGFWAKHILWNKPDIFKSISDTEKRFNIIIHIIK